MNLPVGTLISLLAILPVHSSDRGSLEPTNVVCTTNYLAPYYSGCGDEDQVGEVCYPTICVKSIYNPGGPIIYVNFEYDDCYEISCRSVVTPNSWMCTYQYSAGYYVGCGDGDDWGQYCIPKECETMCHYGDGWDSCTVTIEDCFEMSCKE